MSNREKKKKTVSDSVNLGLDTAAVKEKKKPIVQESRTGHPLVVLVVFVHNVPARFGHPSLCSGAVSRPAGAHERVARQASKGRWLRHCTGAVVLCRAM